jgi:hypothetical protein
MTVVAAALARQNATAVTGNYFAEIMMQPTGFSVG